jgi:ankyrin repeat protein
MPNQIFKSVEIVGGKIYTKANPADIKIVGNAETGITLKAIKETLEGKIDSNTIITIRVHGSIGRDGNHYIGTKNKLPTSELMSFIKVLLPSSPLQIEFQSCYSGNIEGGTLSLNAGSIFTTNSKKDQGCILSLDDFRHDSSFKEATSESNPYVRFFRMLPLKAASYSTFHDKVASFQISPDHNALLSFGAAREFLELEAKRFIEFSEGKVWKNKAVQLPEMEFSAEQINAFSKGLFHYECYNNPKFSEFLEEHLGGNEYLQESVNYDFGSAYTPLMLAAEKGRIEVVEMLVRSGVDANAGSIRYRETPLYQAAKNGHEEVANLLVNAGANVNKATEIGQTLLHSAAKRGDLKAAEILIKKGADVDAATIAGLTPLYIAAQNGHTDVVKALVEGGANVGKTTMYGESPLSFAIHTNDVELLELFYSNDQSPQSSNIALSMVSALQGLRTSNIVIKGVDTFVDVISVYKDPSNVNIYKGIKSTVELVSISYGIPLNIGSSPAYGVYQECQGDSAGRFTMLSAAFNMFLFSSLASRSPMSTLGVGALGTVAYGYKTAVKAIDLYVDLTIDSDLLDSTVEDDFIKTGEDNYVTISGEGNDLIHHADDL